MPFMIHGTISELKDGEIVSFERGQLVDDSTGAALHASHPGLVSRVSHDDDLCGADCKDALHPWNREQAPKRAAVSVAPEAPSAAPEVK